MTLFNKTNTASKAPFSAQVRFEAEDSGQAPTDAKVLKQLQATFALPQNTYRIKTALADLPPLVAMQVPAAYAPLLERSPIGVTVPANTQMRIVLGPVNTNLPAPLLGAQQGFLMAAVRKIVAALAMLWGALLACFGHKAQAKPDAAPMAPKVGDLRVQGATLVFSNAIKGTHNAIPSWLAHQRIKSIHLDANGQGTLLGGVKLFNFLVVPGLQSGWVPGAKIVIPQMDLTLASTLAKVLSAAVTGKPNRVSVQQEQGSLVFRIKPSQTTASRLLGSQVQLGLQDLQLDVAANRVRMGGIIDATTQSVAHEDVTTRADINLMVEGDLAAKPSAQSAFNARADLAINQRTAQGAFEPLIDKVELMATYGGNAGPLVVSNISHPDANARTAHNLSHQATSYLGPIAGALVSAAYAANVSAQFQVAFGDDRTSLLDNYGWDLVNQSRAARAMGLQGVVQPSASDIEPTSAAPLSRTMPGGFYTDPETMFGALVTNEKSDTQSFGQTQTTSGISRSSSLGSSQSDASDTSGQLGTPALTLGNSQVSFGDSGLLTPADNASIKTSK